MLGLLQHAKNPAWSQNSLFGLISIFCFDEQKQDWLLWIADCGAVAAEMLTVNIWNMAWREQLQEFFVPYVKPKLHVK